MSDRSFHVRLRSTLGSLVLVMTGLGLAGGVAVAHGQEVFTLEGAPYAAGVASRAGGTLAVLGGVTGAGADVGLAAGEALTALESRLAEVGLDRDDLVRVRAALAPGDGSEFSAWDEAWRGFFADGRVPARTTVGSSGLPSDALVVLDAVAVFPEGVESPLEMDGVDPALNPNIGFHGDPSNPTAIVSASSGLFLASGALPGRDLEDPEALEDHLRSAMNSLGRSLADHGLQWHDAFFVRVMPTPQPDRPTPDFPSWLPVYERLGELVGGQAPPYTMWGAPGFGASGRYAEIEVWAALTDLHPAFAPAPLGPVNPLLRMTGSERSALASGAIIAPNAELIWLSGVVAPEGTPPELEAAEALAEMKRRLAVMGAGMADVAELRVYRVDDGSGVEFGAAWNEAYGAEFNNPEANPHKPVRTNYLVESLPGGRYVEVEGVIVRPPGQF